MNHPTKVRPDAVLANQSAELQAAIYEMTLPGPGNRTYKQIIEHLAKEHGIRITQFPLRRWRRQHHLHKSREDSEAAVKLAVEAHRSAHPEETVEELFAFGQTLLADEAIRNADVKAWAAIHKLRHKDVDQSLANRRLAIVEKKYGGIALSKPGEERSA